MLHVERFRSTYLLFRNNFLIFSTTSKAKLMAAIQYMNNTKVELKVAQNV